jgi:hypothetical protein
LSEWSDELLLGSHCLLEWHFLRHYDATFSDYFYGLRRVRGRDRRALSGLRKFALLLLVVWTPYVRQKLERWYNRRRRRSSSTTIDDENNGNNNVWHRRLLTNIYPLLHVASHITPLLFQIAFAYNHSESFAPTEWLLDAIAVRLTPDDQHRISERRLAQRARRRASIGISKPIRSLALLFVDTLETTLDLTKSVIPPT